MIISVFFSICIKNIASKKYLETCWTVLRVQNNLKWIAQSTNTTTLLQTCLYMYGRGVKFKKVGIQPRRNTHFPKAGKNLLPRTFTKPWPVQRYRKKCVSQLPRQRFILYIAQIREWKTHIHKLKWFDDFLQETHHLRRLIRIGRDNSIWQWASWPRLYDGSEKQFSTTCKIKKPLLTLLKWKFLSSSVRNVTAI